MIYFAHNGVDHATAAEATAHTLSDRIVIVLLVSVVIVGFITAVVYTLNKFELIKLPRDKEDK